MRFTILFFASLFLAPNLYVIEDASAGVLIGTQPQSHLARRDSTAALSALPQPGSGGKTFGTRKSIEAVYKARLKAFKDALKKQKKEQKKLAKLEKAKKKAAEKKAKKMAKEKAKREKELAKEREEQELNEVNNSKESGTEGKDGGEEENASSKDDSEGQSFLSRFTNLDKESTTEKVKTKFKKSKLRFISRLFLSLFGRG